MVHGLQAEHTTLKGALHGITAELRKLRARAAARTARLRARTAATAAEWRTLCALCARKDGETSAAAAYLQHLHGSKMPASTRDMLLQKLQMWWERSSSADRTAWVGAPRTRAETLAVSAARSFLDAATLHACVTEQNFEKGLAPTSRALLHLLRREAAAPSSTSTPCRRRQSQFQWLRRWRRRWRVKLGRIAAREHIPDDVAHAKAPGGLTRTPHIRAVFRIASARRKKQPREQRATK
jgi:hypothetical protein